MEYLLKNGKNVVIRKPQPEDAEGIIHVMSIADTETLFWHEIRENFLHRLKGKEKS